jgi:hypothetical protein
MDEDLGDGLEEISQPFANPPRDMLAADFPRPRSRGLGGSGRGGRFGF